MEGKRGSECLLKSVSNIDFNADRLQDIAQSMKDSSQRIERLFNLQNTLREDLITSRSEHKVINERLDNGEGDVRELKNK
ncbi:MULTISPECIES: hypothetical protein [Lactiplantibacillus]|uniref:hypothetical protein n=1 Tax=Lactiplantibacillus TaxID=2767842 RepID=UPI0012B6CAF3|nr:MULTISPECIES: hypothetical protein [Lactiplantibacillus]MDL2063678.1 hypothetical protein [Lactiplantibacillus paraplantarum]NLS63167.1 hypothetical protein [Lactiplantibacillus plantarum]